MDSAQKYTKDSFLSLKQTAKIFDVNVEDLLEWNDNNILKPIITQSGEVGYTKEQINKFLTLQNIVFNNNPPNIGPTVIPGDEQCSGYGTQTNNLDSGTKEHQNQHFANHNNLKVLSTSSKLNQKHTKLLSMSIMATVAFVIISFSLAPYFHYTDSPFSNKSPILGTSSKNISSTTLAHNMNGALLIDKQNNSTINKPKNNTSELAAAFYYDDQQYGSSELQIVPLAINTESEINIDNRIVNNFASRPNTTTKVSDYSLNDEILINSENVDPLSMKLGTATMHYGSNSVANIPSLNILIAALFLSFLWVVYAYKNRYSITLLDFNSSTPHHDAPSNPMYITDTLEVVQKLDGTVNIVYGDNEYKVSKPELNSETDRLIQRLMKLTNNGESEIRYDVLEDNNMELNAPLSKIVTRLGFVGTKRDLFFPRTSKNKVVFRRRLTPQNLRSLELTERQLLQELSN